MYLCSLFDVAVFRLKLCSKIYLTHKLSMRIHHIPNPKKSLISIHVFKKSKCFMHF